MKPYPKLEAALSFMLVVFAMQLLRSANALLNTDYPGNQTDYMALLAIKGQLIDPNPNGVLSSWNHSLHHCLWDGVTCGHKHKRVVVLNVKVSRLAGTISPFIGNLSFLRVIDLSNNSLNGQIPFEIGRLFRLQTLYLFNNTLSGRIPANISGCSNLRLVSVGYNNLEGELPIELKALSHLQLLAVHSNNFVGPLFKVIDNLFSLETISCSRNAFTGTVPDSISGMRSLTFLGLGSNKFSGIIPPSISNLSSLLALYLNTNQLHGRLPVGLGALRSLIILDVEENNLSGVIPQSIFNLSSLQVLDISLTQLHGSIPTNIASMLPQLQMLFLFDNYLSGPFPSSITNLTSLLHLELSYNYFNGNISNIHFGRLHHLEWLALQNNSFFGDINFIGTLVNCSKLQTLDLAVNYFTGVVPKVVANLSTTLSTLDFSENLLSGGFPEGVGDLISLRFLWMHAIGFTGNIPQDLGKLQKLEWLDLGSNKLTGEIPNSFRNLSHLSKLFLDDNKLQGRLPPSLGNCANLLRLNLSSNKLKGSLPTELFAKTMNFIEIDLSNNHLEGSLPAEISTQIKIEFIYLYKNNFSGEIPNIFSSLLTLQELFLADNLFHGPIPPSFSSLKDLLKVDLSHNNLSGKVPEFFSTFPLTYLNLSYNNFEGRVPTTGVFANSSAISLIGNPRLCGGILNMHLPQCVETKGSKSGMSHAMKSFVIPIICAFIGVLVVVTCIWLYFRGIKKKLSSSETIVNEPFLKVSYDMLLKATDGFSAGNLLGSGTFGSVFKGILDGKTIAVKVLNLQQRGGYKSFMAECEALRNIRHRNLVEIITACSSMDFKRNDFKALVYEYMTNGSLDKWLSEHGNLSLLQRVDIAIDVAHALNYLHHECGSVIVHCDLKPSNILLDRDMVAHVADFGLAKVLDPPLHPNQSSSICVRGSIGYAAPEYGMGGEASPEADLYSYGILLLELMTRKKPTDNMFKEDFNLYTYAKAALPDKVMQIVDTVLKEHESEEDIRGLRTQAMLRKHEVCIEYVVKIGVACSNPVPQDRMDISDALSKLQEARKILVDPRRRAIKLSIRSHNLSMAEDFLRGGLVWVIEKKYEYGKGNQYRIVVFASLYLFFEHPFSGKNYTGIFFLVYSVVDSV